VSSPTVPYLIRPSRWYDLFAIYRLVDTTYDPLVERFKIPRFPQRTKYFRMICSDRLWVLQSQQKLVGMITLVDDSDRLWVGLLTVLPNFQRQGFGRALIEFAESEARRRGMKELVLDTLERLPDAFSFHQRLGFAEIDRQERYGQIYILMTKRVSA